MKWQREMCIRDSLLSNHPEKKRSHAEMDDTFKMDVIDLD